MTESSSPTGWELPTPAPSRPAGSLVIAGPGARVVAYLLDATLLSAIPTILSLLVIDLDAMFDAMFEAAMAGSTASPTVPVTLDLALVTLIGLGLHFIYLVGFWTSRARATPGMRLLRLQVVDALDGGRLALRPAIQRWVLLGSPIGLLALIEPLQPAASPLSLLVLFILFLTVVADPRRQGFHDRSARSLVVRDPASGSEAIAVGCLVLVGLVITLAVVMSILALAMLGPRVFELTPPGVPI